jgi:hypothetical protein
MPPLPIPLPVERAITRLGNDLALARRRRHISIPLHFIARTLHVFGELGQLASLIDTAKDDIGLTLANEQLPQRVRRKTKHTPTGAL